MAIKDIISKNEGGIFFLMLGISLVFFVVLQNVLTFFGVANSVGSFALWCCLLGLCVYLAGVSCSQIYKSSTKMTAVLFLVILCADIVLLLFVGTKLGLSLGISQFQASAMSALNFS